MTTWRSETTCSFCKVWRIQQFADQLWMQHFFVWPQQPYCSNIGGRSQHLWRWGWRLSSTSTWRARQRCRWSQRSPWATWVSWPVRSTCLRWQTPPTWNPRITTQRLSTTKRTSGGWQCQQRCWCLRRWRPQQAFQRRWREIAWAQGGTSWFFQQRPRWLCSPSFFTQRNFTWKVPVGTRWSWCAWTPTWHKRERDWGNPRWTFWTVDTTWPVSSR